MLQLPKLRREYASPHADTIARKLCDRYGKLVTNCEFSIAVKSEADRERLADRFVGGAGVVGMGCLADRLGELGRALAGFSEAASMAAASSVIRSRSSRQVFFKTVTIRS
jgi:hypothetical protein